MEAVQGLVLKCPNCGAPLDVSPDDVVTLCRYCGQVVSLREGVKDARVVKCLPRAEVEERVFKALKRRGLSPTPLKSEIVYLPFFMFEAHARGTVVVEIRTRNRIVTKELEYKRDVPATVYGRFSEFEGLKAIMDSVERAHKSKLNLGPLNPEDAKYIKVLGSQKTEGEASDEARERAEFNASPIRAEGILGLVGASLTNIKFYDADISISYDGFYFYPVFFYRWREGGRVFTTIANGWDGKVIYTRLPISNTLRTAAVVVAIASPLLFPFLAPSIGALSAFGVSTVIGFLAANFAMKGDMTWQGGL